MLVYIVRRIVYVIPIVISVALVCFLLVHITPGDPLVAVLPADASQELAQQLRVAYGFDRPLPVQFGLWLWRAVHGDLGNSIRKIRVDFGINIVFDRIKILPNTSKKQGLFCVIGRICYSDVDQIESKDDGCLIYIKPTLRGRGTQVIPYDIYSYSRASTSFPHESTADQWFSESQFESYRALGCHIMEQLTEGLEEPKGAQNQADVDFAVGCNG